MGTITIQILSEAPSGEPGDGKVTSTSLTSEPCDNTWRFSAKTLTTAWIEFDIPVNCTINQTSPVGVFTNGIAIDNTQNWQWEFSINGFVSPDEILNSQLTTVVARLYDSEGGALLDTATINHYHSQLFC